MGDLWLAASIWRIGRKMERDIVRDLTDLITVQTIIDRKRLPIPPWYAAWANDFLVRNLDYCKDAVAFLKVMKHRLYLPANWQRVQATYPLFVRQIGQKELYISGEYDSWTVELHQSAQIDRDPRILTYFLGDLPILCPAVWMAAVLAEAACSPAMHSRVYWHEYW